MKKPAGQDELAPDLRTILATVEILSDSRYVVGGHAEELDGGPHPQRTGVSGDGTAGPRLAEALAEEIYKRLYSRQGDRSLPWLDPVICRRHLGDLSAANAGRGTWEPGWRIRSREKDGGVMAERRGVLYRVVPGDLRCADGGPAVGDTCRVRIPKERLRLAPGYYLARGDAEAAPHDPDGFVVRLYWNLRFAGAAPWLAALTAGLNRRGMPFSLKALSDPRVYRRADAGVLYLEPKVYAAARGEILRAWREVRGELRPEVPMFTARLAPGLSVAEGPGDRRSFGEHRCGLIATALVRAFEAGCGSSGARAEAVAAAFRAAGLDPARPHLEPGSTSTYRPFEGVELGAPEPSRRTSGPPSMPADEAACRIGDVLCRDAFWHDGRCTWIGYSRGDEGGLTGDQATTVATLGADLYEGTAGVGLFLAELYAVTGEPSHRRTALAALAHALTKLAADAERYPRLALYVGHLGVAWAARRVAALTGGAELASRTEELFLALDPRPGDERRIDFLAGNAGAILALLDLHRTTDEARFFESALILGEEIRRAAVRSKAGWSWENDRAVGVDPSDPPLTGFAHGAAGIGLALLELFAASGRRDFLDAATGAFAYEDALFDDGCGNWPDLRGASAAGSPAAAPKFMIAWCHGAPGIALSRLCAMAIDPRRASVYEPAARAGLETTARALDEGLTQKDADTGLCHGLCGMVEILLMSAQILEETAPRQVAREAVGRLVARHGEQGDWPSGVALQGRNPSLFLGEAGVGYTLLRLLSPRSTPSVLAPGSGRKGGPP